MVTVWRDVLFRLRMDMYGKADDGVQTKKPWTEQEVLLLLEVGECLVLCGCGTVTVHVGFGITP